MGGQKLDQEYHISDTIGEKIDDAKEWVRDQLPGGNSTEDVGSDKLGTETPDNSPNTNSPSGEPNEYSIVKAGSGHGVEHAFRAQIEHDSTLAEKLKDLYHYKGDITTAEGLHKFSGVAAHQMALAEGYVGPDGSERWVHGTASYRISIEPNGEVVIHEQVLDNNNHWMETERSDGHFETDSDKDPSGNAYEKTHHGGHHNPHHAHETRHIDHLRKSIEKEYTEGPEQLIKHPIKILPEADMPPDLKPEDIPQKNISNLPKADMPPDEPIKHQRTIPVEQRERPSFVPPGTHGDPMHNNPYYRAEPNPQRSIFHGLFGKVGENNTGENVAMNSAPVETDWITSFVNALMGVETPNVPIPPIEDVGNGPMTA